MPEYRNLKCPNCGASLLGEDCVCEYCGSRIVREKTDSDAKHRVSGNFSTPKGNYGYDFSFGSGTHTWISKESAASTAPKKSETYSSSRKIIAAILALIFGSLGVQFFYLGKIGAGIASIIFCWTAIPSFIGFFQCIIWLCTPDSEWMIKHG